MEREGLPPSPRDLALATATFASNGQPDLATSYRGHTLAALERDETCPATRDACLELLLQSCKAGYDAPASRATWTWMRARDIWPTPAGLAHLLVTNTRQRAWRFALETLQACEAAAQSAEPTDASAATGVETSVLHWNIVLSGCVRANELRTAEALLEDLEGRMAPDTVSYNTVLHGYALDWGGGEGHAKRSARFAALLKRMDQRGLPRNDATYRAMLGLCQYEADSVMPILEDAEAKGVAWGWRTYAKAARTLWWAKRPDDAWALIRRMRAAGVPHDARFFSQSVLAAESAGLLDDADRLHREGLKLERSSVMATAQ